MIRSAVFALVIVAARVAMAQAPEECLRKAGDPSAVSIAHGSKTYWVATEACRAQFLGDPERYSQLYDALLELEAEGTPLRAPAAPSLVPS